MSIPIEMTQRQQIANLFPQDCWTMPGSTAGWTDAISEP
jgi:hypothetical protein